MSATDPMPGERTIGYADAVAELDRIVAELDSSQLDIDRLGDLVARAAELIAICRDRIDAARMRVTEIVADLDGGLIDPNNDLGDEGS